MKHIIWQLSARNLKASLNAGVRYYEFLFRESPVAIVVNTAQDMPASKKLRIERRDYVVLWTAIIAGE